MCFTPLVSFTTALIEFLIAGYLIYRIKDKKLYPLVFFVLLLGIYQFTEFMLCISMHPLIWARIGFAAYTFMPILLYHFLINASNNKIKNYFYIIPFFFSSLALFYPNFISYTSCNLLHVTVESLIFNGNKTLMFLYLLYYSIFPVYGLYRFSIKTSYLKQNWKIKLSVAAAPITLILAIFYYIWSSIYETNQALTWINTSILIIISVLMLLGMCEFIISKKWFYQLNAIILATTAITILLLYYLIPNMTFNYSSIFCQFALIYGIASVLLINALNGRIPK